MQNCAWLKRLLQTEIIMSDQANRSENKEREVNVRVCLLQCLRSMKTRAPGSLFRLEIKIIVAYLSSSYVWAHFNHPKQLGATASYITESNSLFLPRLQKRLQIVFICFSFLRCRQPRQLSVNREERKHKFSTPLQRCVGTRREYLNNKRNDIV